MTDAREFFVSVDVETSGPIPDIYSLLTIGACDALVPARTFTCELKPTSQAFIPEALQVSGLSLEALEKTGLTPVEAMDQFAAWVDQHANGRNPVFVGFNAPFDWSFVNYYFHRYRGDNPFGFAALDIKALYMGLTGCSWAETKSSKMVEVLRPKTAGTHDALEDAVFQAELFREVLRRSKAARPS